jgi:hypothetical protein
MKRSSGLRKTANLSESVHRHLNMYAIAASAAAVGMVSAQPAQARIVYTPTHHTLANGRLPIPIDGTHDFTLSDKFYIITGSWSTQLLNLNVRGSAGVVGAKRSAAALKYGAVIGPSDKFQTGKVLMAGGFCETQISSSRVFGAFANTTQRYLGLKFKVNGKVHYGWVRFASVKASACNGGPGVTAVLTGYAYETIPSKSIKAGQTKGAEEEDFDHGASLANPIPDKPQPPSLGVLALGSHGVLLWRRKETPKLSGSERDSPLFAPDEDL